MREDADSLFPFRLRIYFEWRYEHVRYSIAEWNNVEL